MKEIEYIDYRGEGLLFAGTLALSDVEENGIAIDVPYLRKQQNKAEKEAKELESAILDSDIGKKWQKEQKGKLNLDSADQLAKILMDEGYELPTTDKGNPRTNEETLVSLNIDIVQTFIRRKKLLKLKNTYIDNILKETDKHGFLHPSFNLNVANSYRSSSSNPNFQNNPRGGTEFGDILRKGFIVDYNRYLCEIDYSGMEVRTAACLSNDPVLMKEITNGDDMHGDMCRHLFLMTPEQISKDVRYLSKNGFVFPEFYGSWYEMCAQNMWKRVVNEQLLTNDGVPLKEHLANKGIKTYKQFEKQIEKAEYHFWKEKYKGLDRWRSRTYEKYLRTGYVDMITDFRASGFMKKNQVLNRPIQGPAFHCLLWSLIHLNEWLKENQMSSYIIGQIHDSMVLDIDKDEKDLVLEKTVDIMENKVRDVWDWVTVPLKADIEITPLGGNWAEKKEIEI